jgi:hypothetical protein
MSDNVTPLGVKDTEKLVLCCDCGCLTHFVGSDGSLECSNCGEVLQDDVSCVRGVPAEEWQQVSAEGTITSIRGDAAVDLQRERIARAVTAEDTAVAVVIENTGRIRTWCADMESEEDTEWLHARLDNLMSILKK